MKDGENFALVLELATYLLKCLTRLVKLYSQDLSTSTSVDKLRRLKRVTTLAELLNPIGKEIFFLLDSDLGIKEYVVWGTLVPFLLETFGTQTPHDGVSLDKVMDLLLSFPEFKDLIIPTMQVISYSCKTLMITRIDCPYTGSYPYLAQS